jgi:hypothetical protein
MAESDEETIARLEIEIQQVLESRKKLVADITAERQVYESQINRLEIQNKALTERMQPFLKQEEANTVAEQLREYNRIQRRPQQEAHVKTRKKKVKKKLPKYRKTKSHDGNAAACCVDCVETHLL